MKEQPEVGVSGSNNSRNFVKLLDHCSCGDDTNLKYHLESAAQNARYTSPEIQKKLSIENIAAGKENKHYYILADVATDCACNEITNGSNPHTCC